MACPLAPLDLKGVAVWRGLLAPEAQEALVAAVRGVAAEAPLLRPVTPWGKPMTVRMTSAGRVGWIVSGGRYRYATEHPETGRPWPAIPEPALAVWRAVSGWAGDPDSMLVNWYGEGARMGLHRDANENAYEAPVVSVSLGDPGLFRVGGPRREDATASLWLESGDVAVMGGAARLAYHGVDRIRFGTSRLLAGGGRLNLTFRVVSDV
ncbi:alpha-ketoglutarate-dependent dioxygenase AlkB family protein [Rubrimonas cliftonensis]|uniref:Alkylated DNA repair protein (DNA oxidative demethylase) n=1 Tax=Rubrimonas cliftonensis TaxID=89524 RepID=A0A1H4EVJ1_9RHOB|nr:alpha-ketoglutarate-dependent dioxygenase AlkB [Rubrimonas cliftonensis]SEA89043.1 alkylated DNA repair protein (DNA oxidative demethylase) [Rubrimonas cliftonensis]